MKVFTLLLVLILLVGCSTPTAPPTAPPPPSASTAPTVPPPSSPTALSVPSASTGAAFGSWPSSLDLAHLTHLRLFDREHGWALTTDGLYHLEGAHWQSVKPPSLNADGYALNFFFLDAQHAWILGPKETSPQEGFLYYTLDGGQNWETFQVPFGNANLAFLNTNEGWAMASLAAGAGSSSIAIYRTQDAGRSWELRFVNDPGMPNSRQDIPLAGIKSGLVARDPQTAWVVGTTYSPLTMYLYITRDGGQSWRLQNIPLPALEPEALLSFRPPILLNIQEVLLPVEIVNQSMRTAIYRSHDGGESWDENPILLEGIGRFQALSPQEWFFWNGSAFFYTSNGGQNWEIRVPNQAFGDAFAGLQFLNSQEGFLWTLNGENQAVLYYTSDGGKTWTPLNP